MNWKPTKQRMLIAKRCIACVALVVALLGSGCEEDKKSKDWQFVNNSSYQISIRPNGQAWLPVMVSPGRSVYIDWHERVQYIYSPSNRVQPTDGDGNVIVFINR